MADEKAQHTHTFALASGIVVGVLWIAMAVATLLSAIQGFQNDRPDWGLGWGLVGFLLLAAGIIAIVGSWWHVFRVETRE